VDGKVFTPEISVEKAYAACESLKPRAENAERQDFVLTALNMFFVGTRDCHRTGGGKSSTRSPRL
jgi:hypothetical protein